MSTSNETPNRIYGDVCEINSQDVQKMWKNRVQKKERHIDAPVVPGSDKNLSDIEKWTSQELRDWFPAFDCDSSCKVFELGYGTGRMTKYILESCESYVGIDFVDEFKELAENREDIKKSDAFHFYTMSFDEYLKNRKEGDMLFNRFFISGGVFMYMNDDTVRYCMERMNSMFENKCKLYISEPIALQERLTLDNFYSDTIKSNYSAIYRTEQDYKDMFMPLLQAGFKCIVSQEMFQDDFKKQKETKQWIFILER